MTLSLKQKRTLTSVFFALLFFGVFELFAYYQGFFLCFAILGAVLLLILYFFVQRTQTQQILVSLFKIVLPLILFFSTIVFIFFEANIVFKQLMIMLSSFAYYLFFSRIGFPLPEDKSSDVTYFWLDFIVFVAAFLSFIALGSLDYIKPISFYVLLLILIPLSFVIFYSALFARSKSGWIVILYCFLFVISIVETYLIVSFWQINPILVSLILTLILYFFSGVLDLKLRGKLKGKSVLSYILTTFIVIMLIVILS